MRIVLLQMWQIAPSVSVLGVERHVLQKCRNRRNRVAHANHHCTWDAKSATGSLASIGACWLTSVKSAIRVLTDAPIVITRILLGRWCSSTWWSSMTTENPQNQSHVWEIIGIFSTAAFAVSNLIGNTVLSDTGGIFIKLSKFFSRRWLGLWLFYFGFYILF